MIQVKSIHPFPARMAPDLAFSRLKDLKRPAVVLDPMSGSGTVMRHAAQMGHRGLGFDLDPLAVLMSKVWSTSVSDLAIEKALQKAKMRCLELDGNESLPWIDHDIETRTFVSYWFSEPQTSDLRKLAFVLREAAESSKLVRERAALDVLKIALSRIIITKENGASLARDTSHSRPHKVAQNSSFDVVAGFERAVQKIRSVLLQSPPLSDVRVERGDARSLTKVNNSEVDFLLTSPPYLNAIDYLRGHRLSLVWLGFGLGELRNIRSASIGAERGPDRKEGFAIFDDIQRAMVSSEALERRHFAMLLRYAEDCYRFMSEAARVLKPKAQAVLVVGNSCLKGVYIKNSAGFIKAASMVGLTLVSQVERDLPTGSRYLPIPNDIGSALGKRMRAETVLCFKKV